MGSTFAVNGAEMVPLLEHNSVRHNPFDLLEPLPAGSWVAISEAENLVLAFGPDLDEVFQQAETAGVLLPLILRKPQNNGPLIMRMLGV